MILAFNELSIDPVFIDSTNICVSYENFNQFLKFLRRLKSENILNSLVVSDEFKSIKFVNDWYTNTRDRELQRYYRILSDKYFDYRAKADFENEFLFVFDKKEYSGIGLVYACESNGNVISVITHNDWKKPDIEGTHRCLTADGGLSDKQLVVKNYSCESDITDLKDLFMGEIRKNITSGQDLWENREVLFPNLLFCNSVKEQLYQDPERFHIMQIVERLTILQKYFSSYSGRYDVSKIGYNARSESETVKSNPKYKQMRLFTKPDDGKKDYFFDHISFSGKFSGRIYFLPHKTESKCYIGYIGRHLDTKNF